MTNVRSGIILKAELQDSILAALQQSESFPSRDQAEEVYRAGFRAALSSQATAHGLNIPQLRNAEAEAQRRNLPATVYDMRL